MIDIYTPSEGKSFYAFVDPYKDYQITGIGEMASGKTYETDGVILLSVYDESIVFVKAWDATNSTWNNPTLIDTPFKWLADHSTDVVNVGTSDVCLTNAIKKATGTYTGNGQATRTIEIGFTPIAVFVMRNDSVFVDSGAITGGFAVTDSPCTNGTNNAIEITENGFKVGRVTSSVNTNQSTKVYNYIAFGG